MSGERLVIREQWLIPEAHAGRKIGGSSNPERDFSDYAHIVCTVNGRHRDNAADARRLAACWNACDGLTQDHFDGGWTAKGLSRHASLMEDRLATAIALLKRTEEYGTAHSITGQSIRKFLGEVKA